MRAAGLVEPRGSGAFAVLSSPSVHYRFEAIHPVRRRHGSTGHVLATGRDGLIRPLVKAKLVKQDALKNGHTAAGSAGMLSC